MEKVLEEALAGRIGAADAPSEAEFCELWHSEGLGGVDPVESALRGGLLADRLPWVFAAGYQAAIRAVFDDVPREGWVAYSAAEDAENSSERPGVSAERGADGQWRLYGFKSWIGGSRQVRHLFVTARTDGADAPNSVARVEVDAPGVRLSHRDSPGFLGEYSQGFAAFADAPCSAPEEWPHERVRQFGRLEARFVMLAAVGFFLSQSAEGAARQSLIPLVLALAEACRNDELGPRAMAALDTGFQTVREEFEAGVKRSKWPRWDADRRLLTMYSDRIQRRAQRAA